MPFRITDDYNIDDKISSELDVDFRDVYGTHDSNIFDTEKVPVVEDCPRCKTKIALMEPDGYLHHYNMDGSRHYCFTRCSGCGEDIFYISPTSPIACNLDWLVI